MPGTFWEAASRWEIDAWHAQAGPFFGAGNLSIIWSARQPRELSACRMLTIDGGFIEQSPYRIAPLAAGATVTVGGTTLAESEVLYAGLSYSFAGLYQLNVKLPAGLPDGDLPVAVRSGGVVTPAGAYLSVRCSPGP